IFDDGRMVLPFKEGLEVQRGEAADSRALFAQMVATCRQGDLGAEVRGLYLKPRELVMLGARIVHCVLIDDVRLARFDARREKANPKRTRGNGLLDRLVLGREKRPIGIRLDSAHERVRDKYAVMQVQRLAVRV